MLLVKDHWLDLYGEKWRGKESYFKIYILKGFKLLTKILFPVDKNLVLNLKDTVVKLKKISPWSTKTNINYMFEKYLIKMFPRAQIIVWFYLFLIHIFCQSYTIINKWDKTKFTRKFLYENLTSSPAVKIMMTNRYEVWKGKSNNVFSIFGSFYLPHLL